MTSGPGWQPVEEVVDALNPSFRHKPEFTFSNAFWTPAFAGVTMPAIFHRAALRQVTRYEIRDTRPTNHRSLTVAALRWLTPMPDRCR